MFRSFRLGKTAANQQKINVLTNPQRSHSPVLRIFFVTLLTRVPLAAETRDITGKKSVGV